MTCLDVSQLFSLIHVGKCAGGSVCSELLRAGFAFEHIHVRKPLITPEAKYVVLIRDPASRFASAFHWRKFVLGDDEVKTGSEGLQNLKHRMEREFLSCFKDANQLAEIIDPDNPAIGLSGGIGLVQLIGHVPLGFSWYLDDLIETVRLGQIVAAICVESLARDMQSVFGISTTMHDKKVYPDKAKPLSPKAKAVLRRLFSAEYRTLHRLAGLLVDGNGYCPQPLQHY